MEGGHLFKAGAYLRLVLNEINMVHITFSFLSICISGLLLLWCFFLSSRVNPICESLLVCNFLTGIN